MELLRYIILYNPMKEIYPSNLSYELFSLRDKTVLSSVRRNKKFSKIPIPFNQSDEYRIFNMILASPTIMDKTRKFIKANKKCVVKILKKSNEWEKEAIIEYPDLLIEPIKEYINNKQIENITIFLDSEEEVEKENIM